MQWREHMRLLPLAIAKNFCVPRACNSSADWDGFVYKKNRDKHLGMDWMKEKWNLETIHDDIDPTNLNGLMFRAMMG